MRKYLILANSEITANALNCWLKITTGTSIPATDQRWIVWQGGVLGINEAMYAYESLVRRIEEAVKGESGSIPMNEVVVLVDYVEPDNLSAIYEASSWENLIALLILSFPEIQWSFGLTKSSDNFPKGHTLETLLAKGQRNPLLDPTGLRNWVRSQTNKNLCLIKDDLKLPNRRKLAAAIDEEGQYAYFNAYTAYRFGCRADIVTTWALMDEFFGRAVTKPHDYWLLLEDMSLNFADRPNQIHLLHLEEEYKDEFNRKHKGRAYWCPKLNSRDAAESSAYRVLVTTGQARDDLTFVDNQNHLDAKKKGKGVWVPKPSKGIFGLWVDAKLLVKPSRFKDRCNVVNFKWPPDPPYPSQTGQKGHGSPGKLMLVVDTLIRRSRRLLVATGSVETAIQGAVLATEALELSGGRTPTSALDALTLKHHFEVLAECQFSGVAHQIDTRERWKELDAETESISRWFQQKESGKAKLHARMNVLNRLTRVFRENNKFDEEQQCMIRARNVHNSLWLKKHAWRIIFCPFLRYFELLMRSVLWFVTCLSIWVLLFGLLFKWSASYPTYCHGLFDSITSIFTISGPVSHRLSPKELEVSSFYAAVVCGAIMTGVAHLGIFVSHLYTIVSRK